MPKEKKELTRRFETMEAAGWMLYETDDILYGTLQYLATYNKNETNSNHALYITKVHINENKKFIWDLCEINTQKTFKRHMDKLVENGLLEEFTLKINDTEYACYGITNDKNNAYQIISNSWLRYLIDTRNKNGLRVYIYLLDKYLWKLKENDRFIFTQKNIMEALGYSQNSKEAAKVIKNILSSLKREGIIDFVEYRETVMQPNGVTVPIPKMKLLFVAQSEQELKGEGQNRQFRADQSTNFHRTESLIYPNSNTI